MSETLTIRLKKKYDLKNQSKLLDAKKQLRAALIEEVSVEHTFQNMREFVDYIGAEYGNQLGFGCRNTFTSGAVWITYEQMRENIIAFGAALMSIHEHGASKCIGLYGRNSPQWVSAQLACGYYGMVSVPLYDTLGLETMKHILEQTKLRTIVCDTMERAEALLTWASQYIRHLIVIKMNEDDREKLINKSNGSVEVYTFDEMILRGSTLNMNVPDPSPDDLFLVCYTSGSTGMPKGVMYNHNTYLNGVNMASRQFDVLELKNDGHMHVSFLPMAHIFEQLTMSACLRKGAHIAFLTTDVSRLMDDYAYYRPTVFCTVPRLLSRIHTDVMKALSTSSIKSKLFRLAIDMKLAEQKRGIFRQEGLLDYLFFRTIRNKFGGRIRGVVCTSAPLQAEVNHMARAVFSCPFVEIYGATEIGGLATISVPTDVNGGHAGCVAQSVCVKLIDIPSMDFVVERDGIGEICIKSPAITPGYYMDHEKTTELFDEDGFIRMGDVGRWTECGTLQLVDRCKNIFKLAQGEYVAPEKVEQIYSLSPLVINVFVEGNSHYPYAVAVVVPNLKELEKRFPQEFNRDGTNDNETKPFSIGEDLLLKPQISKIIIDELNKIGSAKGLKGFEQARAVHLSSEPFSIANGLLTPTMKLARPQMRKKFAQEIQALYENKQ